MFENIDYIVVGSGLTGATFARLLVDKGFNVLIIERRNHLGGNVHDHIHESGIVVHTYGPHYFRTSDDNIWNFVNRFSSFYEYVACVKSFVNGNYENWPVAASYIKKHIGLDWDPSFKGKPSNFEEAALSMMPKKIYYDFVRGYSMKQWGIDPTKLSADLVKRFDIRTDDDPRLMPHHKYQGIPESGYNMLIRNMLCRIPVLLNTDYIKVKNEVHCNKMLIYTGPIDEYFNCDLGKLKYRGQNRIHRYYPKINLFQSHAQINNPSYKTGQHIRTIEWKHIMKPDKKRLISGTVITREIPTTPSCSENYEYPFPDQENTLLYKKYKERADKIPNLLICGRLGEYQYYDMDQAIGRVFMLLKKKVLI